MKPKYFPPDNSILYDDGIHLFEGENSSYWATASYYDWLDQPIYRCFELQCWKALYCKVITTGRPDHTPFFSAGELKYIDEYKKALEQYTKYLILF